MLTVHRVRFYRQDLKTRFPFRYGIASMTEVPHLFVQAEVTFNNVHSIGMSADLLPPKWFTKNPTSDYESEDLPEMLRVIRHAANHARTIKKARTVFGWWRKLYQSQMNWATKNEIAPLLASFGISLIERAVLDAICRGSNLSIHQLLQDNRFEIDLESVRPELKGISPSDVVVSQPSDHIHLRHTIGMGDPLTDDEITDENRIDDGLPHSLVANIRKYGLTYFKIKLSGDQQKDRDRLVAIASILNKEVAGRTQFTMDGNENYADIEDFRNQFESHFSDAVLNPFFTQSLLFVEQPLHRDYALDDSVQVALSNWSAAPPIIIDESDADLSSLPKALSLGYSGTSHKNCKGVIKGLINAATLMHARKDGRNTILSGEDLANIGPVTLLQDLAVVAALGIKHVERNGHHYFAGLSQFPAAVQEQTLKNHSDLYQQTDSGFVALNPQNGQLNLKSVIAAPFGMSKLPDVTLFEEWDF